MATGLIHIQPAQRASGAPEYTEFAIQAAATFNQGAPLQRDATPSDIEEHAGGATVTGLVGFAMFGATAGVPEAKGSTGYGTTMLVAIANTDQQFLGQLTNAGSIVAPDSGNLGVSYGLLKVGSDWFVDETDTTNVHVTVTHIYANIKAVLFKVISTVIGA